MASTLVLVANGSGVFEGSSFSAYPRAMVTHSGSLYSVSLTASLFRFTGSAWSSVFVSSAFTTQCLVSNGVDLFTSSSGGLYKSNGTSWVQQGSFSTSYPSYSINYLLADGTDIIIAAKTSSSHVFVRWNGTTFSTLGTISLSSSYNYFQLGMHLGVLYGVYDGTGRLYSIAGGVVTAVSSAWGKVGSVDYGNEQRGLISFNGNLYVLFSGNAPSLTWTLMVWNGTNELIGVVPQTSTHTFLASLWVHSGSLYAIQSDGGGDGTVWKWDGSSNFTAEAYVFSYLWLGASLNSHNYVVGTFRGTNGNLYEVVPDVPPPPVSAFSATPVSGPNHLFVQFTDSSTGTPTSWSWNFGDGYTSTSQNPTHVYSGVGSYSVTLTATNAGGSDNEVKTNYVVILPILGTLKIGKNSSLQIDEVRIYDGTKDLNEYSEFIRSLLR